MDKPVTALDPRFSDEDAVAPVGMKPLGVLETASVDG
jgi:hypothetical protein